MITIKIKHSVYLCHPEIDVNFQEEKQKLLQAIDNTITVFKEQEWEGPYVFYLVKSRAAMAIQRKKIPGVKIRLREYEIE